MSFKEKSDDEIIQQEVPGPDKGAVEMMRRLKDSIDCLRKSTDNYSKSLIFLTFILIAVAVIQLIISILSPQGIWKLISELFAFGLIFYAMMAGKNLFPSNKSKKPKK